MGSGSELAEAFLEMSQPQKKTHSAPQFVAEDILHYANQVNNLPRDFYIESEDQQKEIGSSLH